MVEPVEHVSIVIAAGVKDLIPVHVEMFGVVVLYHVLQDIMLVALMIIDAIVVQINSYRNLKLLPSI